MGHSDRRREIPNGAPETKPKPEPVEETPDPLEDGSRSGYERLRQQRIKENLERMQKMGIFQLSQRLNNSSSAPCVRRQRRKLYFEASRKSSRLENEKLGVRLENVVSLIDKPKVRLPRVGLPKVNLPKVSLPKVNIPKVKKLQKAKLAKKEAKRRKGGSVLRKKGAKGKPEIYTEEDEKQLGSMELSWKLFVDGYGADGKRIYDPINGKTCHQCRQKTLGHRTKCCQCQMVQGQFCGDCLYMRYGEHVLEANKNPDWICPVCRGICNCSLCRNAKGWPPTGQMYKKIAKTEYKSVAHYLIQTKRAPPETESEEKVHKTTTPHSAKRSLTFKDMEVPADGKEPHKKAISGQKLVYRDDESGESKDEKGVGESDISPNHIKEEAVSSSEPNSGFVSGTARNSCKKENRDASEERLKTTNRTGEIEVISIDENLGQEIVSQATDKAVSSSEPNAGFVDSETINLCKEANQDAFEERLKTTDKAGENEVVSNDKKLAQEIVSQATDKAVSFSEPNAGFVDSETINLCKEANRDACEERLKTTDEAGENEVISSDKKPAQETVSQATDKAVYEPTASFIASRTRNSCKKEKPDASEGRLETTDEAGENEVISSDKKLAQETVSQATDKAVSEPTASFIASRTRSSCKKAKPDASEGRLETTDKGCATKSCRKAKRSYSPNAIQDSIARRLRPRTNKT